MDTSWPMTGPTQVLINPIATILFLLGLTWIPLYRSYWSLKNCESHQLHQRYCTAGLLRIFFTGGGDIILGKSLQGENLSLGYLFPWRKFLGWGERGEAALSCDTSIPDKHNLYLHVHVSHRPAPPPKAMPSWGCTVSKLRASLGMRLIVNVVFFCIIVVGLL